MGGSRVQYENYQRAMEARRGSYPAHLKAANQARITPVIARGGIAGKECRRCGEWKPLDDYGKEKAAPDGIARRCKTCEAQRGLMYYRQNSGRINGQRRSEEGRAKARPYQAQWSRQKRATDVSYRITKALRHRLWRLVKGDRRETHMLGLLGCMLDQLREHLERQFTEGMTWENYGQPGWEIDHIRPCSSFDLTDPEQVRECFHYTNLQPLWGPDNWKKRNQCE